MTYDLDNLSTMLVEMGEYLAENPEQGYENEFKNGLFNLLAETGLFHDACGKPVSDDLNKVIVTTDY